MGNSKYGVAGGIIAAGLILSFFAIGNFSESYDVKPSTVSNLDSYRAFAHTLGNSDALVTVIEFGDYQCPFCSEWYVETKLKLEEKYITTGDVQLIFVDYPFLGDDSFPAAHASFCAELQGKYWDFHETLYLNQGEMNGGWLSEDNIMNFAEQSGLEMTSFTQCFDSENFQERLDLNLEAAQEHNVNQTPTFLIVFPDGDFQKIEGKQPFEVFDRVISEALA